MALGSLAVAVARLKAKTEITSVKVSMAVSRGGLRLGGSLHTNQPALATYRRPLLALLFGPVSWRCSAPCLPRMSGKPKSNGRARSHRNGAGPKEGG